MAAAETRLEMPPDGDAPVRARTATRAWCEGRSLPLERVHTLVLLVSELVTNAVRHSGAPEVPVRLALVQQGRTVHVSVSDGGAGFEPDLRAPSRHGGWGLLIVDRAASRWGVERDGGTHVWLDLPV